MKKWESEKHRCWCMQVEGFRGHDGSLLGTTGKWGACGWAVVQPDYDEEMGGADGFHMFFLRVIGANRVHVDNKRITDGLRTGET